MNKLRRYLSDLLPPRVKQWLGGRRIADRDQLYDFWRQPDPDANRPANYTKPVERSRALEAFIDGWVDRDCHILEVGCNVGRNLAHLYDAGWEDVAGVEINPHAVELLRATYPQLADATIHVGPAEEVLPELADDSFDLVFTMAVLEHIHPDSMSVFDHIPRLASRLVTVEPRGHASSRQYPHDVVREFRRRGMHPVATRPMSELTDDPGVVDYLAIRYER